MTTMITALKAASRDADAAKDKVRKALETVAAQAASLAFFTPRMARIASKPTHSHRPTGMATALPVFVLDKLFAP